MMVQYSYSIVKDYKLQRDVQTDGNKDISILLFIHVSFNKSSEVKWILRQQSLLNYFGSCRINNKLVEIIVDNKILTGLYLRHTKSTHLLQRVKGIYSLLQLEEVIKWMKYILEQFKDEHA